jgi:twinkle protein
MTIETFLSRLESVKQTRAHAADWLARCPAHNDHTPSLHVSMGDDRRILIRCFAGCDQAQIVEKMGLSLRDLFSDDEPAAFHQHRVAPSKVYVRPEPPTTQQIHDNGRRFLQSRCLDPDYAESLGITGDAQALYFPFYRNGELVNVKTRMLDPKDFRMAAGAELIFFGLDDARLAIQDGEKELVICEGELDWLSLKMAGYPAVLSVPNGAASTDLPYFDSAIELIDQVSKVILAVDADDPGQKLETELMRRSGPEICARARWAEGCNDANEMHQRYGLDGLIRCLRTAQLVPISGLITPDDIESEYIDLYRNGRQRGLSTGWNDLDRYYTVIPGYTTLITGVPSSGKSEWLDCLMINMAIQHNWKFTVFSPENAPPEEHLSRWAEKYTAGPFLDGPTPRMDFETAMHAKRWAQDHLSFITPDVPTLDQILHYARIAIRRYGSHALVIDPWNEVDPGEGESLRDDKFLSKALRQVRRFTEKHNIHAFIVNHPHAMQIDRDTKQYPAVDLYDLHGGSMWANKIGAMLSIWRDSQHEAEHVKLYVKKAKTRRIGRKGRVNFSYNRITGRYTETGIWEDAG